MLQAAKTGLFLVGLCEKTDLDGWVERDPARDHLRTDAREFQCSEGNF